jgi:hypothetical protein
LSMSNVPSASRRFAASYSFHLPAAISAPSLRWL